jgi:hypothetical protein
MQGEKAEQWRILCEQAAIEQDPAKLMRLVEQINRLLEEKEQRLRNQSARIHKARPKTHPQFGGI